MNFFQPYQVNSYCIVFLLFYISSIHSFSVNDKCYDNVEIHHNASIHSTPFHLIGSSTECVEHWNLYRGESLSSCPTSLLSVHLAPIDRFRSDRLPHVELNISVMVHAPVSALFIRLQCIHASSADDVYCHKSEQMLVNGQWQWPCRALITNSSHAEVQVPFQFGYSCFRMYDLSQYMVNVTVFPQKCRSSLLITVPQDVQLYPSISRYYQKHGSPSSTLALQTLPSISTIWSPAIIVDLSDNDGVWLRVEGPGEYSGNSITLSLFESVDDGPLRSLETFYVKAPNTGVKWLNAPNGDYTVYAHLTSHDCQLVCDSADSVGCTLCAHTRLNFSLSDDRTSVSWRGLRTIKDSGVNIVMIMIIFVAFVSIVGAGYLVWLRRKVSRTHHDIPLVNWKKVLILYSDDCAEHSTVVNQMAILLSRTAKAITMLDQNDLIATGVLPHRWLVDSLRAADRVLLVMSPCTRFLFEGKRIIQKRPFPDMFISAANLIISECASKDSSRFAIVQLPYSNGIPYQLEVLRLKSFAVPDQLPLLTAFIHDVVADNGRVQQHLSADVTAPLLTAIDLMQEMMRRQPAWMDAVWAEDTSASEVDLSELPSGDLVALESRTAEGRRRLAEEYGLLPADEDEETEEEEPAFQLLPPSDSESDSNC